MQVVNVDKPSANNLDGVSIRAKESERVHLDVAAVPLSSRIMCYSNPNVHERYGRCWSGALGCNDEIGRNRDVPDSDVLHVYDRVQASR